MQTNTLKEKLFHEFFALSIPSQEEHSRLITPESAQDLISLAIDRTIESCKGAIENDPSIRASDKDIALTNLEKLK